MAPRREAELAPPLPSKDVWVRTMCHRARRSVAKFDARTALALFLDQSPYQSAGIETNRGGNVQKLQDIQPPVSALVFGNIGWRLAEPLRHHRLGKTSRLPTSHEQLSEFMMPLCVDGLWQLRKTRCLDFP